MVKYRGWEIRIDKSKFGSKRYVAMKKIGQTTSWISCDAMRGLKYFRETIDIKEGKKPGRPFPLVAEKMLRECVGW